MTRTDGDVKCRGGLVKRKGAGVTNLGAARQVVGRLFAGGLSAWTGVVSVVGLGCAFVVGFVWLISELILGDPLVALFWSACWLVSRRDAGRGISGTESAVRR